mgnify:CR=1 FL=1
MAFEYWFLLVAVAAFAYTVYQKRPRGWLFRWCEGMPKRPSRVGNGWSFTFPMQGQGHVNYVQWFTPPSLKNVRELHAYFTIEGSEFQTMEHFDPPHPATVTMIIQRRGDNGSAVGEYQSYRWYSKEMVKLMPGTYSLKIPLDVAHWGDIYNGHDDALFQKACQNVESIGLVFGSAGGRGHGVCATARCTFTLLSMETVK